MCMISCEGEKVAHTDFSSCSDFDQWKAAWFESNFCESCVNTKSLKMKTSTSTNAYHINDHLSEILSLLLGEVLEDITVFPLQELETNR